MKLLYDTYAGVLKDIGATEDTDQIRYAFVAGGQCALELLLKGSAEKSVGLDEAARRVIQDLLKFGLGAILAFTFPNNVWTDPPNMEDYDPTSGDPA